MRSIVTRIKSPPYPTLDRESRFAAIGTDDDAKPDTIVDYSSVSEELRRLSLPTR